MKKVCRWLVYLCTLSFQDPGMEASFLSRQYESNRVYNQITFVGSLVIISGLFLIFAMAWPGAMTPLFIWTFVAAIFFMLLALISSVFFPGERRIPFLMLVSMLVNLTVCLLVMVDTPRPLSTYFYTSYLLLMVAGSGFIRRRLSHNLGVLAYAVLAFLAMYVPATPVRGFYLSVEIFLLVTALLLGLAVSYRLELQERHNFLKLRIIIEDRIEMLKLSRGDL